MTSYTTPAAIRDVGGILLPALHNELWCATCGAYRGTTDRPHPHTSHRAALGPGTCHDTDTFTDKANQ